MLVMGMVMVRLVVEESRVSKLVMVVMVVEEEKAMVSKLELVRLVVMAEDAPPVMLVMGIVIASDVGESRTTAGGCLKMLQLLLQPQAALAVPLARSGVSTLGRLRNHKTNKGV